MKRPVFFSVLFCLIISLGAIEIFAESEPVTVLTPSFDLNNSLQLLSRSKEKDYYEWLNEFSVTKEMRGNTTCRASLIDPMVALAKTEMQITDEEIQEKEGQQLIRGVLTEQQKYLVFEVFLKNPDNEEIVNINQWQVILLDDHQNKYAPTEIRPGGVDLKQDSSGIFWGATSQIYFDRQSGGKNLLSNKTQYLKLLIKDKSGKYSQDMFWIFDKSVINIERPFDVNVLFIKYFQVIILSLLALLVIFLLLTRKNSNKCGVIMK